MVTRPRALAWAALSALALLSTSVAALADDDGNKQACITAADEAQRLRDEHRFVKAREQMVACARDVCPGPIRKDCAKWLTDVEASMSTVTLAARDSRGRDFVDVRVSVDGALLTEKLDGAALFVDPGPHTFRFEIVGKPPIDEHVVVREGERNRAVTVIVDVGPPPPVVTLVPAQRKPPIVGYVVAGAGALALGGAAFLWVTGRSDISSMRSGCGATHACAQSDVDAARTKLVIGDVVAGIGLAAIGVGVYMIVTASRAPAEVSVLGRAARFDVVALPGGGVANVGGSF